VSDYARPHAMESRAVVLGVIVHVSGGGNKCKFSREVVGVHTQSRAQVVNRAKKKAHCGKRRGPPHVITMRRLVRVHTLFLGPISCSCERLMPPTNNQSKLLYIYMHFRSNFPPSPPSQSLFNFKHIFLHLQHSELLK
jgi:hypothetical protein